MMNDLAILLRSTMRIFQEPICTAMERLWLERDLEDNDSCDFPNNKVSFV